MMSREIATYPCRMLYYIICTAEQAAQLLRTFPFRPLKPTEVVKLNAYTRSICEFVSFAIHVRHETYVSAPQSRLKLRPCPRSETTST